MGMTLDKAIEILSDPACAVMTAVNQDYLDALGLGIEAMKKLKYDREPGNRPLYSILPGEIES